MTEYIERKVLMDVMCAETCHISSAPSESCNVCHIASVIASIPAAPVMEVRPELRRAVELLDEAYKHAIEQPFVRDPLAYALYQVWKVADMKGRE